MHNEQNEGKSLHFKVSIVWNGSQAADPCRVACAACSGYLKFDAPRFNRLRRVTGQM